MNIDWTVLLTESVFAAVIEGLALGLVALYVWYRRRQALAQGKLEDVILLSFNFIEQNQDGQPQLAFRTPLVSSMNEIFMNDQLVSAIKRAANKTSESDPIVRLANQKLHNMMQRSLINFSNRLNTAGQVAALSGLPFKEEEHILALTYEPGAVTKCFRVILIQDRLFEELDTVGDHLTFGLPYHRDRLTTLTMIRQEQEADQNRSAGEKILAPFMVASPVYHSNLSTQGNLDQSPVSATESSDAQ